MSAGRGIVISSSTVVSMISGATRATSGSVPVFTGQRSLPGDGAASMAAMSSGRGGAGGWPYVTPARALTSAAREALATLNLFTSRRPGIATAGATGDDGRPTGAIAV